jgi:pimeloyl-ACP methyl ester carboxylesterase
MLRRLRLPLLLVRGAQSDLIVDAIWKDVARFAPQARFAEISGGHMLPMEQPAAVATLITEWANELPQ